MLLGPFDGRKKRSRCLACAVSHLKCSSQQPCSACARRGMTCKYPAAQNAAAPVIVESSWTGKPGNKVVGARPASPTTTVVALRRGAPVAAAVSWTDRAGGSLSGLSVDPTAYYLHHFYTFVRRNDFTGKAAAAVQGDLQQLGRLGPATYLRDAMLAIGAMHAANMDMMDGPAAVRRGDPRRRALEYYAAAVSGLAGTLAAASRDLPPEDDMRDAVLWTTLFLGFYELMNDKRGEGWRLHMVHGTSKALRAGGAACCRTGRSRTFFLQARVFEVFRAIVFSDATFLTEPEWANLLAEIWVGGRDGGGQGDEKSSSAAPEAWHPLDALLDLIVLCTKLRYRIRCFLPICDRLAADEIAARGAAIAAEAASLRRALERWNQVHAAAPSAEYDLTSSASALSSSSSPSSSSPSTSSPAFSVWSPPRASSSPGQGGTTNTHSSLPSSTPTTSSPPATAATTDPSMILGRIFYAAASAYLSGIFDYEIDQWLAIRVPVPTLSADALQTHVDTILQYAAPALACTNISPVLLLFPLRIAGARSPHADQRELVLRLLADVGRMYAVASFYSAHLKGLWARMEAESREGGGTSSPRAIKPSVTRAVVPARAIPTTADAGLTWQEIAADLVDSMVSATSAAASRACKKVRRMRLGRRLRSVVRPPYVAVLRQYAAARANIRRGRWICGSDDDDSYRADWDGEAGLLCCPSRMEMESGASLMSALVSADLDPEADRLLSLTDASLYDDDAVVDVAFDPVRVAVPAL